MERILIIKLGAVGDVIHTLPVLETLRNSFPKAHIGWAVEGAAAPVLKGNPALSELIPLERKKLRGVSGLVYFRRWLRSLREKKFDTALDPHNLFKSGVIAYGSGAALRIGFQKFREGNFLFTNRRVQPDPRHRHAVEKYLCLLEPLGIQETQWVVRFPLGWGPQDEDRIGRFWTAEGFDRPGVEHDGVVAINPGASWPSKRWMPERYARVADRLVKEHGIRILILWGPDERPLAERIARSMGEKAVIAPETDLKQLTALIKRCRLLVTGDTGPLHIAAALGVPTVSLFGPSDPDRNGPYGRDHAVVRSPIPPATHWEKKEIGDHWMSAIPVEAVLEAAKKRLEP
ncbi:MAG TPA: glycosyltransferase family 9 protein [Nitrospiria bacterium]|jgi:lipopolysaccharide heptosyltransferase I|nr:glycosyltransferase family 9 protein [Nitrospiria bacterium]